MSSSISQSAKGHYVPYLDTVRCFAVLGVLAVHSGVPGFAAGWVGVDLFFALSGFLITTLLVNEWAASADIALSKFWARRFLRLMPAYYLYALGVTLAIWSWPGSVLSGEGGWTAKDFTAAIWLYFINFAPMGGIWNGQGATLHLWSLAVEEQYYLFWPAFLFLTLKYWNHRVLVSWGLFAAVFTYFIAFATDEQRGAMLYARGFSLFLASAIAISLSRCQPGAGARRFLQDHVNKLMSVSLALTLAVFAIAALKILTEAQIRHFCLPLLVVSYVSSIAGLWYAPVNSAWKYILSRPALLYIGKISYGIYLYHEIVRITIWWATGTVFAGYPRALVYGLRLALYVGLSVAIAGLSYRFLERPFLELKKRFRPREETQPMESSRAAASAK